MKKKNVRIVFENEELKQAYGQLSKTDQLRRRIDYVMERIREKPAFGRPIAKRLIPDNYRKKGINNVFWVELSKGLGWRLIYSLKSLSEKEIVAIILDWFTRHKDYARRFGYE